MAINETTLTKGHRRKLYALKRSVGDKLGEEVFSKWRTLQDKKPAARKPDPVEEKIVEALAGYAGDRNFRFNPEKYLMPSACLGLA